MKVTRKYGHIKGTNQEKVPKIVITMEHVLAHLKLFHLQPNTTLPVYNLISLYCEKYVQDALSKIDQGSLGSCTANSIGTALSILESKQKNKEIFFPSRLFIYYNGRKIEGTTNEDAGAQIHDVFQGVVDNGAPNEHLYVYDPEKFKNEPPKEIYTEATKFKPLKYALLDFSKDHTSKARVTHIKNALLSGYPIVFGFTVYESFESEKVANSGKVPMPGLFEKVVGGHAVCCVGFDDHKKCFIVKNSWGTQWGISPIGDVNRGYFYMPYDYMGNEKLCEDFIIAESVNNPEDIASWSKTDILPDATNLGEGEK